MASSADMKGFYRQKKKNAGINKPKASSKTKKSSSSVASFGSGAPQPTALIAHGSLDLQDDYDGNEELLRQFDMNMAYGPCVGISRMARWERASSLGLNPPNDVKRLLVGSSAAEVRSESLWDGRV